MEEEREGEEKEIRGGDWRGRDERKERGKRRLELDQVHE